MCEPIPRLVEYFVSCGIPQAATRLEVLPRTENVDVAPLRRRYRSAIVCYFPDAAQPGTATLDTEAVCTMCMPHGVRLTRSSKLSKSKRVHTFVITRADGSRAFGTVLTYYEQLEETSPITEWFQRSEREFLERSIVLAAANRTEDSATHGLHGRKEALFASKCICLLTSQPFVFAAQLYLERFYETAIVCESTSDLPVETYLRQLLFEVPCPPPGTSVRFCAFNAAFTISAQRPALNELPLCEYSLRNVLLLFGTVANFVRAFTCVLLERQILIAAHDYETLMLVAEGLCCLLLPFTWPNVYAPILPAALLHYTDSPVPYIMGVFVDADADVDADSDDASDPEWRDLLQASQPTECLLDFAHRRFEFPDDLPSFPDELELINVLEKVLAATDQSDPDADPDPETDCTQPRKNLYAPGDDNISESSAHRYSLNSTRSLHVTAGGPQLHALLPLKEPDSGVASERASMSSICQHARAADERDRHAEDIQKLADIDERASAERTLGMHDALNVRDRRSTAAPESYTDPDDTRQSAVFGDECRLPLPLPSLVASQKQTAAYLDRARANSRIRETVLRHLVRLLRNYDSFVIQPSSVGNCPPSAAAQSAAELESAREAWFSQREFLQNFDKIAFLSDQPQAHHAFLSAFLETQLFATFIDAKVLVANRWFDDEPNWNVLLFDAWIRNVSDYADAQPNPLSLSSAPVQTDSLYGDFALPLRAAESFTAVEKRLLMPDWVLPPPELNDSIELASRRLGGSLQRPVGLPLSAEMVNSRPPVAPTRTVASTRPSAPRNTVEDRSLPKRTEVAASSATRTASRRPPGSREYQTATQFVDALLKESKIKTKRMVLAKLGNEARELGHAELSGLEENTLVAGLVDLLERIWNHGLQQKRGRSAFWSHLAAYQHKRDCSRQTAARILEMLSTDPRGAVAMYSTTFATASACQPQNQTLAVPPVRTQTGNSNPNTPLGSVSNLAGQSPSNTSTNGSLRRDSASGTSINNATPSLDRRRTETTSSIGASISGKLSSLKWRATGASTTSQQKSSTSTPEASPMHRVKNALSSALSGWTSSSSGGQSPSPGSSSQPSSRSGTLRRNGSLLRNTTAPSFDLSLSPANAEGENTLQLDAEEARAMQMSLESALERCPLAEDVASIASLKEIRTDVGCARAFVRLALEKKALGTHLKTLLADTALLGQLYRRYAFLRREDEREQFLYHLLALNTVDFLAFTNTFTQTPIAYRMYIYVGRKLIQWTSANVYFSLAGSTSSTSDMKLPRSAIDVSFSIKSLGFLSTLKLGHDNSGINPRWFVDYVLVRNQVTGYTYRFPNGHWLGRGVDDGSSERLLVAELIGILDSAEFEALVSSPSALQQYSTTVVGRCRSPSVNRRSTSVGPSNSSTPASTRDSRHFANAAPGSGANSTHSTLTRTAKLSLADASDFEQRNAPAVPALEVPSNSAQLPTASRAAFERSRANGSAIELTQVGYPTGTMLSEGRGARMPALPSNGASQPGTLLHNVAVPRGQPLAVPELRTRADSSIGLHSQPTDLTPQPISASTKRVESSGSLLGLPSSNSGKSNVSNVMEALGDAVNSVVKFYYRQERERTQTQLTTLLCGEGGLVQCVEQVLQFAFKSSRLFRQKAFVWDFVEKLAAQHRGSSQLGDAPPPDSDLNASSAAHSFCRSVDEIQKSKSTQSVGKDGKLQILILIGIRDRALQGWLDWMSESPVTVTFYEERSFVRDKQLRRFVVSILDSLNEFCIFFDPSLVRGVR